jgi:hypothetical protein
MLDEVDRQLYGDELYNYESAYKYHFNGKLSSLDPDRIRVQRMQLDDPGPSSRAWDVYSQEIASVKDFSFVVDDSKADRLVAAFRHAIRLCGGAPDPF